MSCENQGLGDLICGLERAGLKEAAVGEPAGALSQAVPGLWLEESGWFDSWDKLSDERKKYIRGIVEDNILWKEENETEKIATYYKNKWIQDEKNQVSWSTEIPDSSGNRALPRDQNINMIGDCVIADALRSE